MLGVAGTPNTPQTLCTSAFPAIYVRCLPKNKKNLFPTKVCWNLAPFLGFPLNDGIAEVMGLEPVFSTGYDLEEGFCLGRALEFGLTLALGDPEDGIVGVAVDGLVVQALVPAESEGMNDSQELPDVVRAMHRTIVEHLITRLQVDGLIFHRPRIPTTGCIHRPSIGPYLHRKRKYGVVAIRRRI